MVKVVVAKVDRKMRKRRHGAVVERHVRGPDGKLARWFIVDSDSNSLGDDLSYVFKRNVAKARRENTSKFGSPDGFRKDVEKLKLSGFADAIPKK